MQASSLKNLNATSMQSAMVTPLLGGLDVQPYTQQFVWKFNEALDVDLFKRAWTQVLKRYDVFYYRFQLSPEGKVQIEHTERIQVRIQCHDLRKNQPSKRRATLNEFKRADFARGFIGLKHLCRFNLFQLDDSHFEWVWTSHHSLFDGRSRLILIQEFQDVYAGLKEGTTLSLPSPPSYRNYLKWISESDFSSSATFWKKYLNELAEPTPLDISKVPELRRKASFRPGQWSSFLSRELTVRLQRWSNRTGISLNTLFQAAWAIYLWRTSGKEFVVFGSARACRKSSVRDADKMVGLFVNTLPLGVRFNKLNTVGDLLQSIRRDWYRLRSHEHAPSELIKEATGITGIKPVFESLIGFETYQLEDLVRPTGKSRYQFDLKGFTDLPLVIQAYDGKRIQCAISFNADRFSKSAIRSLVSSLETIASQLTGAQDTLLTSLSLVNVTQTRRILKQAKGKQRLSKRPLIHERFRSIASRYPNKIAVRQGSQTLTFQELEEQSNQMARYLKQLGIRPGNSVGLFLDRDPSILVSILGILKTGAAYIPFDIEYPKDRLNWMVSDAKPKVVLSTSDLENDIKTTGLNAIFVDREKGRITRFSKNPLTVRISEDAPAYIMYTSGSTGNPKGVIIPHRGVTRLVLKPDYVRLHSRTCTLQMAPVSFDAATFEIWAPLLNGGTCILYPGRIPDIEVLKSQIQDHQVNTLWLTASLFNFIIDTSPKILAGVKQLLVGGEALSPSHVSRACRLLKNVQLINGYGPTENTTFSCCYPIPNNHPSKRPLPIGNAISESSAYVLDLCRKPLPPGVPGELYVGGQGVALGYLNRAALTASHFVPNPFSKNSSDLLYKTGDKAIVSEDGILEFLGRNDNQVKIRGHRIEPGEIQAQLLKSPLVKEVYIKTIQVRNEIQLAAFLVFHRPELDGVDLVRYWLKDRVPEYMIPYYVVAVSALPLTRNGKVDAAALEVPAHRLASSSFPTNRVLSPTQKILRQFWVKVLGSPPANLGASFIESGGHSMLAIQFIFLVRRRFKVGLPFCAFEEHNSIEKLSEWIDKRSKTTVSKKQNHFVIKPIPVPALNPLNVKWRTVFFPLILDPSLPGNLINRAFLLKGNLNKTILKKAVNHVANLHERLRTKATKVEDQYFEEIVPQVEIGLDYKDLSSSGYNEAVGQAEARYQELCLGGMNLNKLPLIELQLYKLAEHTFYFIFSIHHSVADAASLQLLFAQISLTYGDLADGLSPSARPPRFTFHQYTQAHEAWLKGFNRKRLEQYWKKETRDLKSYKFPFERKNVPREAFKYSEMENYKFQGNWSRRISLFCSRHGISKYVFLLSVVHIMIHRYLDSSLVFTSVPTDPRKTDEEADVVGDIGCMLFIKQYLHGNLRFVDVANRTSSKVFEVVENNILGSPGVNNCAPVDIVSGFKLLSLFNVMKSPETGESLKLSGIDVQTVDRRIRPTGSKFNLVLRETENDLFLALHYPPNLVVKHGIERMFFNLQWFMRIALDSPEMALKNFPDLKSRKSIQGPLTQKEQSLVMLKRCQAGL